MDAKFDIYKGKRFRQIVPKVLWAAAFVYALWILKGLWYENFADKKDVLPHLAAWLLIPPIWFVIEYNFLFKTQLNAADRFEAFKHGQDLNRNLWAAISAILLAVYFT